MYKARFDLRGQSGGTVGPSSAKLRARQCGSDVAGRSSISNTKRACSSLSTYCSAPNCTGSRNLIHVVCRRQSIDCLDVVLATATAAFGQPNQLR